MPRCQRPSLNFGVCLEAHGAGGASRLTSPRCGGRPPAGRPGDRSRAPVTPGPSSWPPARGCAAGDEAKSRAYPAPTRTTLLRRDIRVLRPHKARWAAAGPLCPETGPEFNPADNSDTAVVAAATAQALLPAHTVPRGSYCPDSARSGDCARSARDAHDSLLPPPPGGALAVLAPSDPPPFLHTRRTSHPPRRGQPPEGILHCCGLCCHCSRLPRSRHWFDSGQFQAVIVKLLVFLKAAACLRLPA